MYSLTLVDNRFLVNCKIIVNSRFNCDDFVFDTGAKRTVVPARFYDANLCEESVINGGFESKYIAGFVRGSAIKIYSVPVDRFVVGTTNVGAINIWITFDSRVDLLVVGLDVLKLLNYSYDSESLTLSVYNQNEPSILFNMLLNMLKQPACSGMKEYLLTLVPPSIIEVEGLNTENAKLAYALKQLNRFY